MRTKTLLTALVFCALLISIISVTIQFVTIPEKGMESTITGRAQGLTSFCINHLPELEFNCSTMVDQGDPYVCQINITDLDGHQVNVTQSFATGNRVIFNVTLGGLINFTPTNDDVGNYTIFFFGTDNSPCNETTSNITVNFTVDNINDPPYLIRAIPDVEFPANTSVLAFFLNDYFEDPDGDPLVYTSTTIPDVTITIGPSSGVTFSGEVCDNEGTDVRFFATDPFNETAGSNFVEVEVTCEDLDGGSSGGSEGGGGGSGGGSVNICRSVWECQEWFECLPTGFQWQRCYDMSGCEQDKYFKRECVYKGEPPLCVENWLCGEWGQCTLNNTQYRECEDLNSCRTDVVKPPTSQGCVYIATCNDGIQNGDETGVDCGGSCAACAIVEQPGILEDTRWLPTWLIVILILFVLIGAGVVRYYRAEISQGIATLGFLMKHKTYKDILLDAEMRKSFFEQLNAFETQMRTAEELKPQAVYDELSGLLRQYFQDALVLPMEMIADEVKHRTEEMNLTEHSKQMLLGLFQKVEVIEQAELEFDEYFILATIEELRTAVCMTSDYEQEEVARPMYDIPITEDMSFYDEIFVRMINTFRALQFNQMPLAKKEYIKILQIYEPLTLQEKEDIYPTIHWTFQVVNTSANMTGAKVVDKKGLSTI